MLLDALSMPALPLNSLFAIPFLKKRSNYLPFSSNQKRNFWFLICFTLKWQTFSGNICGQDN